MITSVGNPIYASKFRRIACNNTMYNCISKMHCEMHKIMLPMVVIDNKKAIIAIRRIIDDKLIGQDLTKLYNWKSTTPI